MPQLPIHVLGASRLKTRANVQAEWSKKDPYFRLQPALDARTGAWNVWQRGSIDGGQTWPPDAKVSDARKGASYKTASGFGFPYGDYDMVALNSASKTVAVMGESDTSQINGDIWVNHQT